MTLPLDKSCNILNPYFLVAYILSPTWTTSSTSLAKCIPKQGLLAG